MSASISCIVPVYNGARFLAEALESVLAQTLPPNEIIVVDDGSTDATAEVVRAYIRHVFYVRQPHAGAASARNCGIGLATSDLLSFLDADGLWHAEKLARQMHALEANPAAGFCITYLQEFWVEESTHQRKQMCNPSFSEPMPGDACQCLLARRNAFDAVGRFDETKRRGEETDWFLRAMHAGIVKETLADALVYRRMHGRHGACEAYEPPKAHGSAW